MKYIFYIMILSVGLSFLSCERDENGRMPNDIKEANQGLLIVDFDQSDPFINLSSPGDYKIVATVKALFDVPFNKIDVVAVYNGDFTKQYVVKTVTTVPTEVTITAPDLVAAITEITSLASIQEQDRIMLFTSIELKDGTYLPGYTITGANTATPSIRNMIEILHEGGSSNVLITVPCEYDENLFLGDFNCLEIADLFGSTAEYPVVVMKDPDYTGSNLGLIIHDIWESGGKYKVVISKYNYSMSAPDMQIVKKGPFFQYFDLTFRSFSNGEANTCDGSMSFTIGRMCVHNASGVYLGCFAGSAIYFTLTRANAGKKAAVGYGTVLRPDIKLPEL